MTESREYESREYGSREYESRENESRECSLTIVTNHKLGMDVKIPGVKMLGSQNAWEPKCLARNYRMKTPSCLLINTQSVVIL